MSIWGDIRRQADGHQTRKEDDIEILVDIETESPVTRLKNSAAIIAKLKSDSKNLMGELDKLKSEIEKMQRDIYKQNCRK